MWKTHIRRLQNPLTGSHTWADYDGTSVVSKVWGGRANIFEPEANGPAGHIEGVGFATERPSIWFLRQERRPIGKVAEKSYQSITHVLREFVFDMEHRAT